MVDVGVAVAVGVAVGVAVDVLVGVAVNVDVWVGVAVGVGVYGAPKIYDHQLVCRSPFRSRFVLFRPGTFCIHHMW